MYQKRVGVASQQCSLSLAIFINQFLVSKNIYVAHQQQPPYSPDLSPCEFFSVLKIKGHFERIFKQPLQIS